MFFPTICSSFAAYWKPIGEATRYCFWLSQWMLEFIRHIIGASRSLAQKKQADGAGEKWSLNHAGKRNGPGKTPLAASQRIPAFRPTLRNTQFARRAVSCCVRVAAPEGVARCQSLAIIRRLRSGDSREAPSLSPRTHVYLNLSSRNMISVPDKSFISTGRRGLIGHNMNRIDEMISPTIAGNCEWISPRATCSRAEIVCGRVGIESGIGWRRCLSERYRVSISSSKSTGN